MVPIHELNRRLFLWRVGKGVLGFAVLGSVAVACGDDDDDDSAASGGTTSSTAAGPAATEPAGGGEQLTWKRASLGVVSAYVLVRGKEAAVVDTGTDAGPEKIAGALSEAGLGWADVRHVIVTHKHPDHAGGVAGVLGEATGAKAWAGEADIAAIQSPRPLEVAADGAEIFGLQIVGSPGHTPGHICVYDAGAKLLVTGDAVVGGEGGGVSAPNPQYTEDMTTAHASVKKLASLDFETILFGHGEPIETGGMAAMVELAETLG
jgi:glyoxylase-like metal-dependent hydrolase (beta-lactamase superfamily II)